jgi:hypothetical protein
MKKTVKVTFDGKVFHPEEPVGLEPNTRYTVIIEKEEKNIPNRAFARILERAMDLGVTDLAKQHDHYLYGTEKV